MKALPDGSKRKLAVLVLMAILAVTIMAISVRSAGPSRAAQAGTPALSADDAALLDGYRHVEVASVSDALEQLFGQRGYMSHRMRPVFTSRFAGFAVTVQLKKDEGTADPDALAGMLAAIDSGGPNSVYVMTLEQGADIAGMGGLMATAMAARNYSGAVIDGGVRDTAYLQKIGFPVFATGIVPSTSVHHYRFAGTNVPVVCDGVAVSALHRHQRSEPHGFPGAQGLLAVGSPGRQPPVWIADPRDAQYLNTTAEELARMAADLSRQGLVALDGGYASATQILLGHADEYRAKLNAALEVTRPTFNEEMRAGHTNM